MFPEDGHVMDRTKIKLYNFLIMSAEVEPGFYKRYNGDLYRVRGIGRRVVGNGPFERVQEEAVVYDAQYTSKKYGTDFTWIRSITDFLSTVKEYGHEPVPRFTRVPEPDLPTPDQDTLTVTTIADTDERTVAYVALNGAGPLVVNHGSDMVYETLKGQGEMVVDGIAQQMYPGAVVSIPRGTPYQDTGHMVMAVTAKPPFDANMVEVLGT